MSKQSNAEDWRPSQPPDEDRLKKALGEIERVSAELAAGVAYFRAAGVEHDVINGGDQDLIFRGD